MNPLGTKSRDGCEFSSDVLNSLSNVISIDAPESAMSSVGLIWKPIPQYKPSSAHCIFISSGSPEPAHVRDRSAILPPVAKIAYTKGGNLSSPVNVHPV